MKLLYSLRQPLDIFREVFEKTGVSQIQIQGRCRIGRYVKARVLFAEIARKEGYSFSAIGRHLKKDHTTVIYHLQLKRRKFKPERIDNG